MEIILASSSPARKKLFSQLGIPFKVITSNLDESKIKKNAKGPKELVTKLALEKAKTVVKLLKKRKIKDFLVVGADSIAAVKNKKGWTFLDKPRNKRAAKKMTLFLKDRMHRFYTGLAVIDNRGKQRTVVSISKVYFKNFSDKTLRKVLDSGVWRGKAGGYGIKECLGSLIKKFEGSYTNVLGLPLEKLIPLLKEFGVKIKLKGGEKIGRS